MPRTLVEPVDEILAHPEKILVDGMSFGGAEGTHREGEDRGGRIEVGVDNEFLVVAEQSLEAVIPSQRVKARQQIDLVAAEGALEVAPLLEVLQCIARGQEGLDAVDVRAPLRQARALQEAAEAARHGALYGAHNEL